MDMTMIRLFTRDQNYYRKDYDAAWSASAKLPTPLPAQALSTCQSKIFPGCNSTFIRSTYGYNNKMLRGS
jgi:hypothetical protein